MSFNAFNTACFALMLTALASCGSSSGQKAEETTAAEHTSVENKTADNTIGDINLINSVYDNFVFGTDTESGLTPEECFTAKGLKQLQDDYEYDCDQGPCYAFNALRTYMQDSNPDTDGASTVIVVTPEGDGSYLVSYFDMGWPGKTRITMADGKIDSYRRITD